MSSIATKIKAMMGKAQPNLDLQFEQVRYQLAEVRKADAERLHQQRELEQLEGELRLYGVEPMPNGRYQKTLNKGLALNLPEFVPFLDALVIQGLVATFLPGEANPILYYIVAFIFTWVILKFEVRAIQSELQRHFQAGGNAMTSPDPVTFRNVWQKPALWATMLVIPALGVVSSSFSYMAESQDAEDSSALASFAAHLMLSAVLLLLHFLVVVYYDEGLRARVITKAYEVYTKQVVKVEQAAKAFNKVLHTNLLTAVNTYLDMLQGYMQRGEEVSLHTFDNDLIGYVNAASEYNRIERTEQQQVGIAPEDVPYKDIIRRYNTYQSEADRIRSGAPAGGQQTAGNAGRTNQRQHQRPQQAQQQQQQEPIQDNEQEPQANQDTYQADDFFANERNV